MSETKHTPGPWSVSDMRQYGAKHISISAQDDDCGSFSVANIEDPGVRVDDLDLLANARLIAAAPEILQALDDLVAICSMDFYGETLEEGECPTCDRARAAIKKARGE